MPIRGFITGTDKFPIQKCAIFRKFKQFRRTCHVFSVIDAEIAEKGHFWTETSLF